MPEHNTLVGAQCHEPKGADTADAGQVYVADGLGSGSFQDLVFPDPAPITIILDDPVNLPISDAGSMIVSLGETGWGVLPPGDDDQMLVADSTELLKLKWIDQPTVPDTATISISVASVAHGFATGEPLSWNGTNWVLARANAATTLGTHVCIATDADNFKAVIVGLVTGMSGLTAGEWYYVSEAVAGDITTTEPVTGFSNPIGQALTTTSLMVYSYRAQEI